MDISLKDSPIQQKDLLLETSRLRLLELESQNEAMCRTQAELAISHARYFDLYERAPVGYFTIGAEATISEANITGSHLFEMQPHELLGTHIQSIIFQADHGIYSRHTQELTASGTAQSCELRMAKKGQAPFWAKLIASLDKDSSGNTIHRLIVTNISERKLVQDDLIDHDNALKDLSEKLQLKNVELQAARLLADKSNQAKSEFLSSMSHELRSPLNSIVGFAQLLESGTPTPTPLQQKNIQRILTGGWYLLKIVNEILDLSLIESGKMSFNLQSMPVASTLWQCRDLMTEKALNNNVRVHLPQVDSSIHIIADPVRLTQVMINLLSNAIKYNRPNGTVVMSMQRTEGNMLRIAVTDTGKGLMPQELEHLFESFNRLGQERGHTEGTGIGLAMTKKLTEMMGGAIGVESVPGVGSEFWVEFKLAPGAKLAPSISEDFGHPSQSQSQAKPAVLYVEDSLANVDLVAQILEQHTRFHLYSTGVGHQGVEMARRYLPMLILLDINLRGMGGLEVLALLKNDPLTRDIPVIAVSANAMPLDVANGLAAGFFRYLTKPFLVDDFLEILDLAHAHTNSLQALQPL